MSTPSFNIVPVNRFEEPLFSELSTQIFGRTDIAPFGDSATNSSVSKGTGGCESTHHDSVIRLGAFEGTQLIGWSCGWFERGAILYMANSAVVPWWRRRGVYSALVSRMIRLATDARCGLVRSRHATFNQPVLVAKLKLGFVITGTEYSEELGLLVRMSYFATEQRRREFEVRAGPAAGSSPLNPSGA